MKSASRQNAEAQKFVQQKTTLAAAGQRLYNQTKNRKEGFQVNIKIIQRQCGGTEFLSQPHRLHLGAQNAAGVDELCFTLPEAWAGCTVALYLRRSDGTLLAPVSLDTQHCVTVDRRLTGSTGGQWMLAAIDASGYAAYTRPGSYDTYAILPTDGGAEELPPSQYEQFVARVLESASTASTAAQRAAASAASTASNAGTGPDRGTAHQRRQCRCIPLCSPCRGCCRTGRGAGAYRRSGSERERQKRHRKTDGAGCGGAFLPGQFRSPASCFGC